MLRTACVATVIGSLFLLHGTVVIDKHEGAVIFWVDVALGALVSRTQVASGVVVGQSGLGGTFLLSSTKQINPMSALSLVAQHRAGGKNLLPRALGSVGRNQDVGPAQGVESPVGDVVQDVFHSGQ